MPKPRPPRSSPDLLKAWEHVAYEIEMYTYIRSIPSVAYQNTDNSGRALYESLAIHIRNLIDFLCLPLGAVSKDDSTCAKKDDIIASDYVSSWVPTWVGKLRSVRDAIVNKQVMHLTYVRVPGGTPWDWLKLWDDLDPLLVQFLASVNGNHGIVCAPETIAAVQNNPGLLHVSLDPIAPTGVGSMRTLDVAWPGRSGPRTLFGDRLVAGPSSQAPRVSGACTVASPGTATVLKQSIAGGTTISDVVEETFVVAGPTTTRLESTSLDLKKSK